MQESTQAELKHLLNDPLPKKIYCDSNFFVSCILRNLPARHKACQAILLRLIKEKTLVFFNTIVYYESYIAFLKNILERSGRSKNLFVSKPEEMEPYIDIVKNDYNRLIELINGLYTLQIKGNDKNLIDSILKIHVKHKLDVGDSFHLGTLLFSGEKDILSFDIGDFKKIPNINLWCNIY